MFESISSKFPRLRGRLTIPSNENTLLGAGGQRSNDEINLDTPVQTPQPTKEDCDRCPIKGFRCNDDTCINTSKPETQK